MYLTLGDVMSRATTLAGGRRDWDTSEVSFWANLAAVEVFNQTVHTPMEGLAVSSTTSGEQRISLPSDFDAPISISNLSVQIEGPPGRNLDYWDATRIDSNFTALGEPIAYALYSDWLELWPTPDSSYSLQLRYWKKQPTMLQSTTTPLFDERWHLGWLYKTAAMLELSRNNYEGAAVMQNQYLGYMGSLPNDRAKRQMGKDFGVRYQRSAE